MILKDTKMPVEKYDYRFADQKVGDRLIWRLPCVQTNDQPVPLHIGTVIAFATSNWIQVREDFHWRSQWLNLDELNLCEKILEEEGD